MMRTQWIGAVLLVLLAAPATASAQQVRHSQLGLAAMAPASSVANPHATVMRRRAGWEVGAALGAVGGLAFGRFIVVMYNDGRAEKMGTGREVLTMVGAAAIGAGIGAFIQKLVS